MRKKLLTIILSIFVAATAFTSNVFADVSFYTDSDGSNPSDDNTNKAFGFEIINSDPYEVALKEICDKSFTGTLVIPDSVEGLDSNNYSVTKIANYATSSLSVSAVILPSTISEIGEGFCDENSNLKTIVLNSSTVPTTSTGYFLRFSNNISNIYVPIFSLSTYKQTSPWSDKEDIITAPFDAISSILPGDYPTTEDDGWICEYGVASYLDNSNLRIFDISTFSYFDLSTNSYIYKVEDDYLYVDTSNFREVLFKMNNGVLSQFVYSFIFNDGYGGILNISLIYKPLGGRISIAGLLSNYGSNFPTSEDYAWSNSNGTSKVFFDTENGGSLCLFDNVEGVGPINIPLSLVLDVLEEDTKYSLNFNGINIDFIIENDNLKSIVVNDYSGLDCLVGTYSKKEEGGGSGGSNRHFVLNTGVN